MSNYICRLTWDLIVLAAVMAVAILFKSLFLWRRPVLDLKPGFSVLKFLSGEALFYVSAIMVHIFITELTFGL